MNNTLLPIGSIIVVKNTEVMICAYFNKDSLINDEKYDYACCLYPNGMGKDAILVKKEDIQKVIFIGYHDDKFLAFKEMMEK